MPITGPREVQYGRLWRVDLHLARNTLCMARCSSEVCRPFHAANPRQLLELRLLHLPLLCCTSHCSAAPPTALLHLPLLSCTSHRSAAPSPALLHLPLLCCIFTCSPASPTTLLHLPLLCCTSHCSAAPALHIP